MEDAIRGAFQGTKLYFRPFEFQASHAGVAQLAEQLIRNQ